MKRAGFSFAGTALVVVAGFYLMSNFGLLEVRWPWQIDIASTESAVAQVTEAEVVEIQPIALDCRARITAEVPLEGTRRHKVLGATYRTDRVRIEAVGDIDTCVDGGAVQIVERADGTVRVMVPADAVRFERPRVDAVATLDSVHFSKGWVGKLTDVAPWVSDNSGLTPAAYAYAQSVIGSSACMSQAWNVTERAMADAYVDQMEMSGRNADDISVEVIGEPDFGQAEVDVEGFDFEVEGTGTLCTVDAGAYTVPVEDAPAA